VPAEITPPALARLVDFAERPRTHEWSLRAALVRYAQPEPQRVEALLESVRRIDFALGKQSKRLEREGEQIWRSLEQGDNDDPLIALLRIAQEVDELGETLASWAVVRGDTRPNDDVDRVSQAVARQLDDLGVPREERPPNRQRGV
jgi:hypothetical protein